LKLFSNEIIFLPECLISFWLLSGSKCSECVSRVNDVLTLVFWIDDGHSIYIFPHFQLFSIQFNFQPLLSSLDFALNLIIWKGSSHRSHLFCRFGLWWWKIYR
jgi:hypothetical protein